MEPKWPKGKIKLSVIMISLNEEENMPDVLENLKGWADEVFLIDSYSNDKTIDIALSYGVNVVQKKFISFGDQWNFAATKMPTRNEWVMKIDPDERLTQDLKDNITKIINSSSDKYNGFEFVRNLWFMGKPLNVKQKVTRLWRNGKCKFSKVLVNEHPIIDGVIGFIPGELEHLDSINLHHWFSKQNNYSTLESINTFNNNELAADPDFFGNSLERRMWLKKKYSRFPMRHIIYFLYCYFYLGAFMSGRVGFIWAKLRVQVFKMREYKLIEMRWSKAAYKTDTKARDLLPDSRVKQY